MKSLNVLVGCEYSGTVRDAFIRCGHDTMAEQWGGVTEAVDLFGEKDLFAG